MSKLIINSFEELSQYVGKELGVSEYLTITQEQINQFADATHDHQWIHADMVLLPGETPHIPYATASEWSRNHSVTFMAPTKVFNMPGLISSAYIIPDNELRLKFKEFLEAAEMNAGNIFAYICALEAYRKGDDWRKQMLVYVKENADFVSDYLTTHIPQVRPMIPEASFLVWLDGSGLGFETTDELYHFFIQDAGLGLNKGSVFGPGGEQHLRLNIACSRLILAQAMGICPMFLGCWCSQRCLASGLYRWT